MILVSTATDESDANYTFGDLSLRPATWSLRPVIKRYRDYRLYHMPGQMSTLYVNWNPCVLGLNAV